MCMCWFTYAYCFFGEGQFKKKNNNNNKGICAPKSKLANISLFKEFVGGYHFDMDRLQCCDGLVSHNLLKETIELFGF